MKIKFCVYLRNTNTPHNNGAFIVLPSLDDFKKEYALIMYIAEFIRKCDKALRQYFATHKIPQNNTRCEIYR